MPFTVSICLFYFSGAGSWLLRRLFCSCGERGYPPVEHVLVTASLLQSAASGGTGAGPGAQAQQLPWYGLGGPAARGLLPDQGSNPCLLPRQVDSLPLSHREALRPMPSGVQRRTPTNWLACFSLHAPGSTYLSCLGAFAWLSFLDALALLCPYLTVCWSWPLRLSCHFTVFIFFIAFNKISVSWCVCFLVHHHVLLPNVYEGFVLFYVYLQCLNQSIMQNQRLIFI